MVFMGSKTLIVTALKAELELPGVLYTGVKRLPRIGPNSLLTTALLAV